MSKSTEADRVFTGVVSDILAGVIRPRDRISERDLVARFGVSRTPVREATKRLLERGFVETGPKGVAVVVEIGPEDLRKLYTLRLQLECGAAKQIVANITPQEIDELKQINKRFKAALAQRDLAKMLEIRADFHAVLNGATRNRWLEMILVTLRDKAYMVRHYHWQDFDRAAQTLIGEIYADGLGVASVTSSATGSPTSGSSSRCCSTCSRTPSSSHRRAAG